MKRALLILAGLLAWGALAQVPLHLTQEQCFLASDAGSVNRDSQALMVELQNQGSTTLYCALTNQADAVPLHARAIPPAPNDGGAGSVWLIDHISPSTAIFCRAGGGIDQQSSLDGGQNGTADGGPQGCTIVSQPR